MLVIMHGGISVGKSNLVSRFTEDLFFEHTISGVGQPINATVSATVSLRETLIVNNNNVRIGTKVDFQIWDPPLRKIQPPQYRGAAAAIIVYDITNADSFQWAKSRVRDLKKKGRSDMVITLAGNKKDLEGMRMISFLEAQQFAEQNEIAMMETSAKSAENVIPLFHEIARGLAKVQFLAGRAEDSTRQTYARVVLGTTTGTGEEISTAGASIGNTGVETSTAGATTVGRGRSYARAVSEMSVPLRRGRQALLNTISLVRKVIRTDPSLRLRDHLKKAESLSNELGKADETMNLNEVLLRVAEFGNATAVLITENLALGKTVQGLKTHVGRLQAEIEELKVIVSELTNEKVKRTELYFFTEWIRLSQEVVAVAANWQGIGALESALTVEAIHWKNPTRAPGHRSLMKVFKDNSLSADYDVGLRDWEGWSDIRLRRNRDAHRLEKVTVANVSDLVNRDVAKLRSVTGVSESDKILIEKAMMCFLRLVLAGGVTEDDGTAGGVGEDPGRNEPAVH